MLKTCNSITVVSIDLKLRRFGQNTIARVQLLITLEYDAQNRIRLVHMLLLRYMYMYVYSLVPAVLQF